MTEDEQNAQPQKTPQQPQPPQVPPQQETQQPQPSQAPSQSPSQQESQQPQATTTVESPTPQPATTPPITSDGIVGAVLIVGGGISGMQSALDLAESGYMIYLVDKSPSIGGAMAQLDKTFPTNDCAMCIMAPTLVSTGRHHNIKLITNAEIENVEGDAGNFKVRVRKRNRFVDEIKFSELKEEIFL